MSFDDWLLALHVLSAFALVAALVVFWVAIVALRRTDLPEQALAAGALMKAGSIVVVVGSLGVIVFGVWLAIALDGIEVWNAWVIAAIVLWAIASETGRRSGEEYMPTFARAGELVAAGNLGPDAELAKLARTQRGLALHTIASVLTLLILVDMIWKPGA